MLTTQPPKKIFLHPILDLNLFFLNIHLTSYNIFSGVNLKHITPFTIALHKYLDAFCNVFIFIVIFIFQQIKKYDSQIFIIFFFCLFFFYIDISFNIQISGSKRISIFEMHIGFNTNIGMHGHIAFRGKGYTTCMRGLFWARSINA